MCYLGINRRQRAGPYPTEKKRFRKDTHLYTYSRHMYRSAMSRLHVCESNALCISWVSRQDSSASSDVFSLEYVFLRRRVVEKFQRSMLRQ